MTDDRGELDALRRDVDRLRAELERVANRLERIEAERADRARPEPRHLSEGKADALGRIAGTPAADEAPTTAEGQPAPSGPPADTAEAPPAKQEPVEPEAPAPHARPRPAPPVPPRPPAPPSPSFGERFRKWAKLPADAGWEQVVGQFVLPRLGILALLVGLGFFVAFAVQRWGEYFTPPWRVAAGYALSAVLLVAGWRLEAKYRTYARILFGGGFAAAYIVSFATHYVPMSRVFAMPGPALLLMGAVVVAWAAVAQWRRSRLIASVATLLGHATVLLSTLTLGEPADTAVVALVVLALGSGFFLLWNAWYIAAAIGLAGSYGNYLVWLVRSEPAGAALDFWLALAVLGAFFLIYALAEILSPEGHRRERVPLWFRSGYATANAAGFIALATLLAEGFAFAAARQDLLRIGHGAVLVVLGIAYVGIRRRDPLHNMYFILGVTGVTIGLATRYSGSTLAAILAVETVALLVSAWRSGLLVVRLLALAAAGCATLYGLGVLLTQGRMAYDAPAYFEGFAQFTLSALALLAASEIYRRVDWGPRSPGPTRWGDDANRLLWQLDLVSEPPDGSAAAKPIGGLLYPLLYALGALMLLVPGALQFIEPPHRTLAYAGCALVLTVAAGGLRSKPFGLAALALFVVAVASALAEGWTHNWLAAAVLGVVAFASEARCAGRRGGLVFHQHAAVAHVLYAAASGVLGLWLVRMLDAGPAVLALCVVAVAAAALSYVLRAGPMALVSLLMTAWGAALWALEATLEPGSTPPALDAGWLHGLAWLLLAVAFALDVFYSRRRVGMEPAPFVRCLPVIATGVALLYVPELLSGAWVPTGWALVPWVLAAHARTVRSRTAVALAVLTAAIAAGVALATPPEPVVPLLACYAVALVTGAAAGRYAGRLGEPGKATAAAGRVCVAAVAVLLVALAWHIDVLRRNYLTLAWAVAAVGLYGLAFLLRQAAYRIAGLAVFGLAYVRALADAWDLDGLNRILAFAGLGTLLLLVGFGYFKAEALIRGEKERE